MFVQLTEILNPFMNRGLPPNLAGADSSLDFACKGLDIAAASYAGELNILGGMNVGVGNVSAEMHNQSVKLVVLLIYSAHVIDDISLARSLSFQLAIL